MKFPFQLLLIRRLLLAYAIYSICRLLFISFNYTTYSNQDLSTLAGTFFYGLLFDTSAIVYTHAYFILLHIIPLPFRNNKYYQRFLTYSFLLINGAAILLNLADTGYYPFSGKRSGIELFHIQQDILDQLFSYLTDYWYLTLILLAAFVLMYKAYKRTVQSTTQVPVSYKEWLLVPLWLGLCFIGARGGWNLKPITPFDAARMVKPEMVSATINTPFQMIISIQQIGVEPVNYMSDSEAIKAFNPIKQPAANQQPTNKNIVLLIVESLGKEYVGYHNNGKGYTPFIDSLMQFSLVFDNAYANGKRSVTGLPSIVASMPSLMEDAYSGSFYQSNKLISVGGYLQHLGYDASFYHGAKNGSMSFDNFISITNGGSYFGLNEYPHQKDFDGSWGISDGPYLQYVAEELGKKKQPFYSGIFTLSSHHPYHIPESEQHLFEEGTLPIHKSIRYADYCLRRFFEKAATMPWYANTIFIITADHSAENEKAAYQSLEGIYRIPLFIFDPSNPVQQRNSKTTQQLDILPAILQLAGYPKPYFSFGNNPFDTTEQGFAIQYSNNIYQIIDYPFALFMSNGQPFMLCNIEKDVNMKENLLTSDTILAAQLTTKLKAFIQTYNDRLIRNKTTVD